MAHLFGQCLLNCYYMQNAGVTVVNNIDLLALVSFWAAVDETHEAAMGLW